MRVSHLPSAPWNHHAPHEHRRAGKGTLGSSREARPYAGGVLDDDNRLHRGGRALVLVSIIENTKMITIMFTKSKIGGIWDTTINNRCGG